jgi:glycosyltransferase involved in cell wall biosynthesis
VYPGVPAAAVCFRNDPSAYLAYVGPLTTEYGIDRAVAVARQSGVPLRIASPVLRRADEDYVRGVVLPAIRTSPGLVDLRTDLGDRDRLCLVGNAAALLCPAHAAGVADLTIVESLAAGTPVVAWRQGAAPELIDDGVTGFVVGSVPEAVEALHRLDSLNRVACRRSFEQRFTSRRMALDYVDVYRRVIEQA